MSLDADDLRRHGWAIFTMGDVINKASHYLEATDGSPEEEEAERVLGEIIGDVTRATVPRMALADLIMSFASLVCAVAPQAEVQAWFDDQGQHIREALGG